MYINSHTLSGNIGADAVVRDAGDTKVLSFRFANTSPFGQKITTWYNGSLFGRQAETLAPMLKKGTRIVVVGESYAREYTDKNGNARTSNEFRATSVQLVGSGAAAAEAEDEGAEDLDNLF